MTDLWNIDCSVRIDDIVKMRTAGATKNLARLCFRFDPRGVEMWCGCGNAMKIAGADLPRFYADCTYETQIDGIVLDYFLTTYETTVEQDEAGRHVLRFFYCKAENHTAFQYEMLPPKEKSAQQKKAEDAEKHLRRMQETMAMIRYKPLHWGIPDMKSSGACCRKCNKPIDDGAAYTIGMPLDAYAALFKTDMPSTVNDMLVENSATVASWSWHQHNC